MKRILFFLYGFFILITACHQTKFNNPVPTKDIKTEPSKVSQNIMETQGFKLLEQKCFVCHLPVPHPSQRDKMTAPPLFRVQAHYKARFPEKEAFQAAIKDWLKKPEEKKVRMPGARNKFGIMPYIPLTEEESNLISEILYEFDFATHYELPSQTHRHFTGKGHLHGKRNH